MLYEVITPIDKRDINMFTTGVALALPGYERDISFIKSASAEYISPPPIGVSKFLSLELTTAFIRYFV